MAPLQNGADGHAHEGASFQQRSVPHVAFREPSADERQVDSDDDPSAIRATSTERTNETRVSQRVAQLRWARSAHLSKKEIHYRKDSWISEFAMSLYFEYATLSVIAANAIWMGIETDMNTATSIRDTDLVWIVGENIFCSYFLIEILIRFLAFSHKLDSLKDFGFIFDSVLVSLMVFETWVIYALDDSPLDLGFLRLLRLLRLSRLAHVMHQIPELLTMVKGIFAATRSVGSVLLLLVIFCYVFAIVFTGNYRAVAGKTYSEEDIYLQDYFGDLGQSMFTLFINGTLLDDLSDLIKAIREDSVVMLVCFLTFILLSSFTVLNMLIGILCDVVAETEELEIERRKVDIVRQVLTGQFEKIDKDGSGKISNREFDQMREDPDVLNTIEGQLGIDRSQLKQLQTLLFSDSKSKKKELTFDDFLKHLIRLRPDEHASPMDIQQFRKVLREQETSVLRNLTDLRDRMEALRNGLTKAGGGRIQLEPHRHNAIESMGAESGDMCWAQRRADSNEHVAVDQSSAKLTSDAAAERHAKLVADASDFELVEELRRRLPAGSLTNVLE